MQQFEDGFEDDDTAPSLSEDMYRNIAPPVKEFLINYYGEAFYNSPAQTFRDIERLLKDDILLFAALIPGYLYRNRTITNSDQWEDAWEHFSMEAHTVFSWPGNDQWYNRKDEAEDDMDLDEDDLPVKAKNIIEAAGKLLDYHQKFKAFMHPCCAVIITAIQLYLEKNAAFDLSILSTDGYVAINNEITGLAENLAEDLYAVTEAL